MTHREWTSPDGRIRLINADCLEVLPTLEPGSVDAVVTDPPFNAGKDFDNDNLSPLDFQAFCDELAIACHRINVPNVLVEVGKNDKAMRSCFDRYFDYRYALCLNYTNSMRNGSVGYANFGLVLWYSRGGKCHKRYKDRLDSAVHNTKHLFEHPSPKEVEHYQHLCRMFTPEDGMVLDPFAGSFTTAVACIRTNRRCIAIEKEPKYFDIGVQRCEAEYAKLALLDREGVA